MKWQPIETAPKDGTPVLLYGDGLTSDSYDSVCTNYAVGVWEKTHYGPYDGRWISDAYMTEGDYYGGTNVNKVVLRATHWMTLPRFSED